MRVNNDLEKCGRKRSLKAKLSLCLTKHNAMKAYGKVEE
jgi:hypothetical protein